jgi:Cys-rich four helix bundle protein (predicted Tat secretion target)
MTSRREFFEKAAVVAGGVLLSQNAISTAFADTHPESASSLTIEDAALVKKLISFAATAAACAQKGEVCAQHCSEELAQGQANFDRCNTAVRQMIVLCNATAQLASMKSVRIREVLASCLNACHACYDACNEHKAHWAHGMHLECKACAEACDQTLREGNDLKKLL